MKRFRQATAAFILSLVSFSTLSAQGPRGNDFGFGIILGDPLGATVKYYTAPDQALLGSIGGSYFGAPRINVDYHWHFDAFNSQVVKLFAGPGLSLGFGNGRYYWLYADRHKRYYYFREDGEMGFGMRMLMGLNIVPKRTPIEIFLELGPLIGISPGFGATFDAAIGIRFYPG